jgi:SCY1-like protein 1
MALSKSSTNTPTILSPDPAAAFNDEAETEDYDDGWGGFGEPEDSSSKAIDDDPWATPPATSTTSTSAFDDKGEPDFAGWLAAQSNAKKPLKTGLPKGLTKSTTATKSTRPVIGGRASTTGSAATRKVVIAPKKEAPKVEEKKAKEDEEEGWGDAW